MGVVAETSEVEIGEEEKVLLADGVGVLGDSALLSFLGAENLLLEIPAREFRRVGWEWLCSAV